MNEVLQTELYKPDAEIIELESPNVNVVERQILFDAARRRRHREYLLEEAYRNDYDIFVAVVLVTSRFFAREQADDIINDAFARAWKMLDSLRNEDRLLPWLKQIVANVTINYRLQAQRESMVESYDRVDGLVENFESPEPSPETYLVLNQDSLEESKETRRKIELVILALQMTTLNWRLNKGKPEKPGEIRVSDRDAEIFLLSVFYKINDICQRFNMKRGAIDKVLCKVRQKLAAQIEQIEAEQANEDEETAEAKIKANIAAAA